MKTFQQFQESLSTTQQARLHHDGAAGSTNGSTQRIATIKATEKRKRPLVMDRLLDRKAKAEYDRKQAKMQAALRK